MPWCCLYRIWSNKNIINWKWQWITLKKLILRWASIRELPMKGFFNHCSICMTSVGPYKKTRNNLIMNESLELFKFSYIRSVIFITSGWQFIMPVFSLIELSWFFNCRLNFLSSSYNTPFRYPHGMMSTSIPKPKT